MNIQLFDNVHDLAACAAASGADAIRAALRRKDAAAIVLASAASQIEMVNCLIREPGIEWQRVTLFHLDEYVGLPIAHGASFRRFLWERFITKLPLPPRAFHFLNGERDAAAECSRVGRLILQEEVDVAFIGIGENAHVAFNDPPADFATTEPYIVVELDEPCRRQQVGEGWFPTLTDVPQRAISMSVYQILRSKKIICTAPDARKAAAVQASVEGPVSPLVPATCLQRHGNVELYLDEPAASLLAADTRARCVMHGAKAGAT